MIITAQNNKVFKRIHDGVIFGKEIYLGFDYSTGEKRQDKEEYYEQIDEPIESDNPNNTIEHHE